MTHLIDWQLYLLQAGGAPESGSLMHRILESNLLNVVLVALILGFFVKKFNLFAGVDTQREKIANEVESIAKRRQTALEQLEAVKARTANLNTEIDGILKDARQSAQALSDRILAEAREEAAKIVDNARRRMEMEQRGAVRNLEERLLNDALADARQQLSQSLNAADQTRSVENFIAELPSMAASVTRKAGD